VDTRNREFPYPLILSIGQAKGGDCKTWCALNIAAYFGCLGYDVTVVDCNSTHDLLTDYRSILADGYWPRFKVVTHSPLDTEGNQNPMMDFGFLAQRQIVVFDTAQYLNLQMTKWAWRNCHLLISPVTPNIQQLTNYEVGIQYYLSMPKPRAPLAILPCKVNVLRNSIADQKLDDNLNAFASYEEDGIFVPKYGTPYQIPLNTTAQSMSSRWIYSETTFKGKPRFMPVDFLLRVDISLTWIRSIIERFYGPLPQPRLNPIPLNPSDRSATIAALKAEFEARKTDGAFSDG
jgi:hypothetical protein